MIEVQLRRLGKTFPGGVKALHDVTLDVARGELLVVVGPSGGGKTTLLRLLAGLENPTDGEILLDGRCANDLPPRHRNLALVFQRPALYPHLCVRDNLALGLRLGTGRGQRIGDAELRARVAAVAQQLRIGELLDRGPRELSGGQQHRVCLGRALVRHPGLLLLDEPFSGADPDLRGELGRELRLLRRGLGTTIMLVTHDPLEALNLGDRAAVLKQGVLLQVGTPADLLEHPADRYVAGLLGWPAMNFFEGALLIQRGEPRFATGEWLLPLPTAAVPQPPGERLTLGIPPGGVRLQRPGEVGAEGTVESVRLLSATQRLVVVRRGDRQVSALVTGEDSPAEGQVVSVGLDWGRVCWFDSQSGRALRAGTSAQHYEPEASARDAISLADASG